METALLCMRRKQARQLDNDYEEEEDWEVLLPG